MEDQEKQSGMDDRFVKGFNNGYLLSLYEPDLLAKILPSTQKDSEYMQGFHAGIKKCEIEKGITKDKNVENSNDREIEK